MYCLTSTYENLFTDTAKNGSRHRLAAVGPVAKGLVAIGLVAIRLVAIELVAIGLALSPHIDICEDLWQGLLCLTCHQD